MRPRRCYPRFVKQCPKCFKSVADDTWLCDCGNEFHDEELHSRRAPAASVRPVCRLFASLLAFPVGVSIAWLLLIYVPRNRGGQGPDLAPDLTGVLPTFV